MRKSYPDEAQGFFLVTITISIISTRRCINGRAMHKERQANRAEMEALVAKTLGISEADVQQAHKDGKSLADLAGDKRDELVAAMVAFENAKIDKAVADGKLTQAQADKMKANTQKRVENRVDGKGGPGGKGHGGMRGGPDGVDFDGPDGGPPADAGSASPAA